MCRGSDAATGEVCGAGQRNYTAVFLLQQSGAGHRCHEPSACCCGFSRSIKGSVFPGPALRGLDDSRLSAGPHHLLPRHVAHTGAEQHHADGLGHQLRRAPYAAPCGRHSRGLAADGAARRAGSGPRLRDCARGLHGAQDPEQRLHPLARVAHRHRRAGGGGCRQGRSAVAPGELHHVDDREEPARPHHHRDPVENLLR